MKPALHTKTYITCPHCSEGEWQVSHLFDLPYRSFGPWSCKNCGRSICGTVSSGHDVDIELLNTDANLPLATVLELKPRFKPLYLVLRDTGYGGDADGKEYLYNEHTCPTNFMSQIECIVDGDDFDPHGIFAFVGTIPVSRDFDFDDEENIEVVLKDALSHSKVQE